MKKEKPTAVQIVVLVVCILAFLGLVAASFGHSRDIQEFVAAMVKAGSDAPDAKQTASQLMAYYSKAQRLHSGLVSQIQVILSTVLVITNKKRGFITAVILNLLFEK